jgi:hypothetical protein
MRLSFPIEVLQTNASSALEGRPRLRNALQEFRAVLDSVVKPIIFRFKTD